LDKTHKLYICLIIMLLEPFDYNIQNEVDISKPTICNLCKKGYNKIIVLTYILGVVFVRFKFQKYLLFTVLFITLLFFLSSCTTTKTLIVRVPFEELQGGAYYGGSLLFNTEDPSMSQLGDGTLIAFQDIRYGWVQEDEETFTSEIKSKHYGYLFIQDIELGQIIYDFLVYDENGKIIKRKDRQVLPVMIGDADFSNNRTTDGFSGVIFHNDVHSQHAEITDSCLLSFIHEKPQTEENTLNREPKEEYRRVLFRVQQTTNSLVKQYPKGIVAISHSSPKALVVNTAFHSFVNYDVEEVENYVVFIQTDNLPVFAPGDFLLDHEMGDVKKVLKIIDDDGMLVVLETEEADMQDALGSVIVNVDGPLEEIIDRYGSEQDRENLERARVNLIEKEWDIPILEEELADVKIENTFRMDVDCSIHLHSGVDSFSSKGKITFPMSLSSILVMEAMIGFEQEHEYRLADPEVSFSVCGLPVKVGVPIDFYYDLKAQLAKLDFEFGPEMHMELGFKYDVGAKVKYKWKVIPDGIKSWSSASGIHSHSEDLHGPILDFDADPVLSAEAGFKTYPGIKIACVLRPQMEIPFALQSEFKDTHTTLDFMTEGEMEMVLDVKFYKHTFKFGRVFKYTKELYNSAK
ncbi:MAG: hypothetical protein U9N62_05830, partial [Thermotogota bacterium]|nr:hypothetical protein [Thermotogota bacterium]